MWIRILSEGGEVFHLNYFFSSKAVDLVLAIWQGIPAPVIHNLEKAQVLKKIFWHLNVDGVPGDYFEFGVAHGHSLRAAKLAIESAHSKSLGIHKIERTVHGFDTFESFQSDSPLDEHVTWNGSAFNVSLEKVSKRFKKASDLKLHKINALDLLIEGKPRSISEFQISSEAAVILFDMDLYSPTKAALNWSKQIIKSGTFLIFDEYYSFGGDPRKGEARALSEFLLENPHMSVRDYSSYGAGGRIFIVHF
jgi:O-methyltransferase